MKGRMRDAIVKFPKKTDELFLDIPKEPASILLDDIETIFGQYPQYQEITFHEDYAGTDRVVIARSGECL